MGSNHSLAKGASVAPFETLAENAGLLKLTLNLRVHLTPSGREREQTSSVRDKSKALPRLPLLNWRKKSTALHDTCARPSSKPGPKGKGSALAARPSVENRVVGVKSMPVAGRLVKSDHVCFEDEVMTRASAQPPCTGYRARRPNRTQGISPCTALNSNAQHNADGVLVRRRQNCPALQRCRCCNQRFACWLAAACSTGSLEKGRRGACAFGSVKGLDEVHRREANRGRDNRWQAGGSEPPADPGVWRWQYSRAKGDRGRQSRQVTRGSKLLQFWFKR